MFCLVLSLLALSSIPYMISSSNTYSRYRKLEKPEYTHESLEDFIIVIPMGIAIRLIKTFINYLTYGYFKGKLQGKYSEEELERKITKCSRGAFKVVYFTFAFTFGLFKVLRMTNFAPSVMFGNGEMLTTFGDWPFTIMPEYLKFYYLLSFSYYIEDGITHIFLPPNYDYWEMVLHHIITALLIFVSYKNGMWNLGIIIIIQMDCEDISIGLIRVLMDFSNIGITVVLYLSIMISWIYFRFFCYIYIAIWTFALGARLSIDNNTTII
mmetsp:Transcript_208/g.252  ORF Transcript_208/g.252 Transcript_208/m.252 type:complete len:267 (+) Transcript_208:77-877(+)